ncbi:hypothetical protein [Holdemania filiformis]|uniref:hypothetical protein n=1 Tax=Holdemania filiformis TaxID=61171 RepID=UPI0026764624|nr:hypothetical protein [Holdemania filiformis]
MKYKAMINHVIQLKKEKPILMWAGTILIIVFVSFLIASFFCFPFNNGQVHLGADTGFHINRIISLMEAQQNNVEYPYLFWNQNYNFGYPTPIFYCNLFLYWPAALLTDGMLPVLVYKKYVFGLVWIATMMIGLCSYKVSKRSGYAAILAMLLFMLNTHSITDILRRGGLGELLALVFIPICLAGIYQTMYKDSRRWIWLAVGYCGLVLSHNISFILMCIVFAVFALINMKKLWREKIRILNILQAILAALACAWFFIAPMLEQMGAVDMVVSHTFNLGGGLAASAVDLSEIFNFTVDTSVYLNNSPGPFLIFMPLIGFAVKEKRKRNPFIFHCWIIGYVSMLMMTKLFPWQLFPFFSFMQFVQRLLPVCIPMLALAGGYYWFVFIRNFKRVEFRILLKTASVIVILIPTYSMLKVNYDQIYGYPDTLTVEEAQLSVYGETQETAVYNVQQLSSADYLPYNVDVDYKDYREWVKWAVSPSESFIDSSMKLLINDNNVDESEYGHFKFVVKSGPSGQWLTVPRTYYYGYEVDAIKDGEVIDTIIPYAAENTGLVTFDMLESEGPITYDVVYRPTSVQTSSMAFSIMSVKVVLVLYVLERLLYYGLALTRGLRKPSAKPEQKTVKPKRPESRE